MNIYIYSYTSFSNLLQGHTIEHARGKENRLKYYQKKLKPYKKKLDHIKAVKFGNDNEDKARDSFCKRNSKYEVTQVGMVVPENFPMFAVSPDGLIRDKTGKRLGHGVLEIKCLESFEDQPIVDPPCLDEQGKLKKNDKWNTQIQLTAWATNSSYAILFLYSGVDPRSQITVEVPLDKHSAKRTL